MTNVQSALLVVSLTLPLTTHAQGRPDFSGTWTMDRSRSESAMQADPIGPTTVAITQTPTGLEIATTRDGRTATIAYKLDGSPSPIPGGSATSHWEGATLVTETVRDIQGQTVTTKESRRLNDKGEMLVDTVLVVQHGYTLKGTQNYGAGKDVFTRVKE
ncbi:MAG TPA: hypothetical protein VKE51_19710 [Vicinamibacterales bacterium]|nr:hypothetical protein [Vicinamibacterales bacterium]